MSQHSGLTQTKNYTFSAQPGGANKEERSKSESTILAVARNAVKVRNSIAWVMRKWREKYLEHMNELTTQHKLLQESGVKLDEKRIKEDLRNHANSFYSAHTEAINADRKQSVEWYKDHWSYSSSIMTDMLSRIPMKLSVKANHKDPNEGGDICLQIPTARNERAVQDSEWIERFKGLKTTDLDVTRKSGEYRVSKIREFGTRKTIRIKLARATYADLDINFHRPMPTGFVKYIRIKIERFGCKFKYWVTFTVETEIPKSYLEIVSCEKWAAVKIGWASDGGAATALEYSSNDGEVDGYSVDLAEADIICAKIDSLKNQIDKELVPKYRDIIAKCSKDGWPEWLIEKTKTAAQWRSPYRIMDCAITLRNEGLVSFDISELKNAVQRRRNLERKISNKRKNRANLIASDLHNKFEAVGVPNTDYKKLKEKKSDMEHVDDASVRRTMTSVSPGQLRERIVSKFGLRAFIVDISGKKLGGDTLSYMHARTEALAKGQGVLDNLNELAKAAEKKRKRVTAMKEGRDKAKAARELLADSDVQK